MPMTTTTTASLKSDQSLSPWETKMRFARRFLRSLARVRTSSAGAEQVSRRIKTSSYACMAGAVGKRRAWSRALIFNLRKRRRATLNIIKKKKKKPHRDQAMMSREGKLRDLVPGGQGMDTCRLLDETAHYVKCLAIQVQVMRTIVDRFSATSTTAD